MATLSIIKNDPWLEPYADAIEGRHQDAINKEKELIAADGSLKAFANAYNYFGLHRTPTGWVFREWAPNATGITLIGDFSKWKEYVKYALKPIGNGVWEIKLKPEALHHGQLYKMLVHWEGGMGERIPAYATRVVQDEQSKIFSAQVWAPEKPFKRKVRRFVPDTRPLLIYECHIGMAQEREGVGTYTEFKDKVLPRIVADGYNAIQIMAIQEHPYYGSFGYHVSSFYAPSSRFGTPEELKELIDAAHEHGIAVIMDIVHSHAVKNEVEGLGRLDGSYNQYFYGDDRREHPAWDSLCFDYGKNQVLHFLLSNCKYWLDEFHFDGFRFDGVTSMLYYNHGLGQAFGSYGDYYNGGQDTNAITYLTLANKLIHEVNRKAITIAEEMSGMPGLATPFKAGGIGFDYRMAMGIPDYWIKMLKEKKDEDWHPTSIFWELTNRRADEKTISYVESHDQALVGDKTVIFRLIDDQMYWHMMKGDDNAAVNRGIAMHKMIRLVTLATINGGYLNFMGNEFGHPEWLDAEAHAHRQWYLADRPDLKYAGLAAWDKAQLWDLAAAHMEDFQQAPLFRFIHEEERLLAFERGRLLFAFNFHELEARQDLTFAVTPGKYVELLSSDEARFAGHGNLSVTRPPVEHFTTPLPDRREQDVTLYLPPLVALVLRRED